MQTLAIAHELSLFRPQPTHHAPSRADRRAPCLCHHIARRRAEPPRPRRGVTPLARSYRDEAAVLRWQRSRRRGSRPREWHVLRGRHTRPPSRHARCMLGPRCSRRARGNGRAASPRASGTRIADHPPAPRPRRVTSVACATDALSRAARTQRPRRGSRPPRVGEGFPIDNAPPPVPIDCAVPDDMRCPVARTLLRSRVGHDRPLVSLPMVAPSFFLFRPQPTHHASARFMAMYHATSTAAC